MGTFELGKLPEADPRRHSAACRDVGTLHSTKATQRYRSTAFRGLPPSLPFAREAAFLALLLDRPPS